MTINDTLAAETLSLNGPDALAFAQSQFSSQVEALVPGHWQWSAWLDAKGRVRYLFHLLSLGPEQLLLLLRGGEAATMARRLQPFVFRAKLSLSVQPPRRFATGPALSLHSFELNDHGLQLGCGEYSLRLQSRRGGHDWLIQQVRAGWPWLPAPAQEQQLAPALSLHRLGGLALDKGCYPGQEIIARLHYRGGLKRHLARVRLLAPASPGQLLRTAAGAEAGQLLHPLPLTAGEEGLAVLVDDAAAPKYFQRLQSWDGTPPA